MSARLKKSAADQPAIPPKEIPHPTKLSVPLSLASAKSFLSCRRLNFLLLLTVPVLLIAVLGGLFTTLGGSLQFTVQDLWCQVRETWAPDGEQLLVQYQNHFNRRQPDIFSEEHNSSLMWGTYRPGVLMGVKSRSDEPLLFGIAWYDAGRRFGVRHEAVDSDKIIFKWVAHDGRYYGRQEIVDLENQLFLEVVFVKHPKNNDWAVRVTSRRQIPHSLNVVVYFANEAGPSFPISATPVDDESDESVSLSGSLKAANADKATAASSVNRFRAIVSDRCFNRSAWSVATVSKSAGSAWQLDIPRIVASSTTRSVSAQKKGANVILLHKTYTADFRFEVAFSARFVDSGASTDPTSPYFRFSSCQIQKAQQFLDRRFHQDFALRFPFQNIATVTASLTEAGVGQDVLVHMAESALSNMIGGMGYWVGSYRVVRREFDIAADRRGHDLSAQEMSVVRLDPEDPAGPMTAETSFKVRLFSGVPSRAKFPRGFLWDEGFHQLLIGKWDVQISNDVIAHWIIGAKRSEQEGVGNSTKEGSVEGWIPREQILGDEARSRVPSEFVAQHPTHANPPSMILQIQNFAASASSDEDFDFLERLLPHLRSWRDWYHRSQCGGNINCAEKRVPLYSKDFNASVDLRYRWRSRNRFHLLASGLDDYPRPVCKKLHQRELHVDMYCWAWLLTKTLNDIERIVSAAGRRRRDSSSSSNNDDVFRVAVPDEVWLAKLDELHWNDDMKQYADLTGCTRWNEMGPLHFSPYIGYVNLFPLLTMMIDDPARALSVIRLANKHLSSGFGLASLSIGSRSLLLEKRQQHENYWTGPVWININFMFLRALKLKYIALVGNEAAKVYNTVRNDIIRNLAKEYKRTGNVWENYHWTTGTGQGTSPFTGWSALVVLIMSEQYQ